MGEDNREDGACFVGEDGGGEPGELGLAGEMEEGKSSQVGEEGEGETGLPKGKVGGDISCCTEAGREGGTCFVGEDKGPDESVLAGETGE